MNQSAASTSISDLISPGLAAEVRRIELRTRRSMSAEMLGNYRSAFRGSGLVFSDLRAYEPGDDIKHIHWKATARTGKVQVKSYDEERQLSVVAAVDLSPSTVFGQTRTNSAKALEFAALIGLLARANGDALGVCLFGSTVTSFMPPRRNRSQIQQVLLTLLEAKPQAGGTDIGGACRCLHEHLRRPGVIFLISDFVAPPFEKDLGPLAARHDVIAVLLRDPLDATLPRAGLVRFRDPESGADVVVDTSSPRAASALRENQEMRRETLRKRCADLGAGLIEIDADPLRPLAEFMQRRSKAYR